MINKLLYIVRHKKIIDIILLKRNTTTYTKQGCWECEKNTKKNVMFVGILPIRIT